MTSGRAFDEACKNIDKWCPNQDLDAQFKLWIRALEWAVEICECHKVRNIDCPDGGGGTVVVFDETKAGNPVGRD